MTSTAPEPQAGGAAPKTDQPRSLLWRLLGVRRRPGKRLPFAPTKWGWVLLLGVVGIVGGGAFAEYSMQPDFCRSCHIMEPYYQAWHASTHKNVPCVDCHFEPGLGNTLYGKFQASSQAAKYLTHTYGSKPHAEIKDASCMREGCHVKRLLEGKVNWAVDTQHGAKITIRFDHAPHLNSERRGKQLRCVSCHSQIVQGQHLVVTLDTCFLCHMKGVQHGRNDQTLAGCTSCHEAPKQQIRLATGLFNHADYVGRGVSCENCHSEVIKGDGAVPRQMCWTCHNQTQQIARYGETGFIHKAHVTEHKVECASCHVQIEHNLTAALPKGTSLFASLPLPEPPSTQASAGAAPLRLAVDNGVCGQCHEQMHGGPQELYRGTGGRGVPDMPSPMYRAQVDCIACHHNGMLSGEQAQVVGQTFTAAEDRCTYCHGDKYTGMLPEWKKTVSDHLDKAEAAYGLAKAALDRAADLDGMGRLKAQRLLDDAKHNINLVKLGHGVHNVTYSTALLNAAADCCKQAQDRIAGKAVAQGP